MTSSPLPYRSALLALHFPFARYADALASVSKMFPIIGRLGLHRLHEALSYHKSTRLEGIAGLGLSGGFSLSTVRLCDLSGHVLTRSDSPHPTRQFQIGPRMVKPPPRTLGRLGALPWKTLGHH